MTIALRKPSLPSVRTLSMVVASVLASLLLAGGLAPASFASESFGISRFQMQLTEGELPFKPVKEVHDTQAGGHPDALTTTLVFNQEALKHPVQDPKDVVVDLPPGLLGDPQALPRCSLALFDTTGSVCPDSTQVGTATLIYKGQEEFVPLYNLQPEADQSAEFGLSTSSEVHFLMTAHVVRSGGSYGLTVVDSGIPMVGLAEARLTFWGVPADPSHDFERGVGCGLDSDDFCHVNKVHCVFGVSCPSSESGDPQVPFLTLPADCAAGPTAAHVTADSWESPGAFVEGPDATLPAVTGCDRLQFEPSIAVQPETTLADAPSGLDVTLSMPQTETPSISATPQLRDSVVTLPQGMSVSPSVVDGIAACAESGSDGINFEGPESEELAPDGLMQLAPGHCPAASTLGTAEAVTPLLPEPVKGHIYLAEPGCGKVGQPSCTPQSAQDGQLFGIYLELGGTGALANAGVNLKVRGTVSVNPATGQLTTTFANTPQLPFGALKIHLNGGPQAPIASPQQCGPAVTTADFTPWSALGITPEGLQVAGTSDALPSSFFEVTGCGSPPPFDPSFLAQTTTATAGAFTPFDMLIERKDREQDISRIQLHMPSGLLGMLSSVPLCGEPQAVQGACSATSQIATVTVASGAGTHPYWLSGEVYLTGPYDGEPFGISVAVPAIAGPFDLGLVVVRGSIAVDSRTSAITITTDPLPQIIDGVPVRLKAVSVDVDRPDFMFNPTDCDAQEIASTITAVEGAVERTATPFAVAGCRRLAFTPSFKASTNGHTSRKRGASLFVRLSFPKGAIGNDANIAEARVELPKALPSYLPTLQKACIDTVFESNPAQCPAGSIVGVARTSTPVLPVELKGPVYFVSHGSARFPSLVIVLQGDGVRVDLQGETFISRKGITSSTFKTIPDVPVDSFELLLPQGKNHALAANVSLCKHSNSLLMPTKFVAQDGAAFERKTKIAVTGCGKSRHKHAHGRKRNVGKRAGNAHRASRSTDR